MCTEIVSVTSQSGVTVPSAACHTGMSICCGSAADGVVWHMTREDEAGVVAEDNGCGNEAEDSSSTTGTGGDSEEEGNRSLGRHSMSEKTTSYTM